MPQPHVVVVTGDHEYGGEMTLPKLAAELSARYDLRTTWCPAQPDQNAEENIPGLEALADADLAIFYLRWRRLPDEQLKWIEQYLHAGKPVMGFRTTSHGFKYPEGDPREAWNGWAGDVFGAPPGWGVDGHTHYGHQSTTDVSVAPGAETEPIMAGVTGEFHVRSWLYHVVPKWPPADAVPLLIGHAIEPRIPAPDQPVAWTWTNTYGARAFFTTLGHPEDFEAVPLQRLLINAVHWCLGIT
ncbi:MAG: ThuA domain-containing protein, partial [Armatimonadetes bacterium]|nr:ThuA domain-containing protein [Armatimonadota bacterium]